MVVTGINYYVPGAVLCAHTQSLILETDPCGCHDRPQIKERDA